MIIKNDKVNDSSIEWIPELNSKWKIGRVKNLFYLSKELSLNKTPIVLSLSRSGVKIRDISNNEGQLAASYEGYNHVKKGDLLLNPMDLYSGANCNVSEVEGVISPAYSNLRAKIKLDSKYYDYFFKIQYWTMAMFAHGKGVSFDNRWTLNNDALLNYEIPILPFLEQQKIVETLDKKIEKIDILISNQEKQIEKLKEYKQALITKVVTNGLSDNLEMKSSGVEWIENIPCGWNIYPIKYLFSFSKGLSITKEDLRESGVKVISYGQLHSKKNLSVKVDNSLYRFVSEKYLESNPECLVNVNDMIMADTSEDLEGTCDFVRIDKKEKIFAGYHSIIFQNKQKINTEYLAYQFTTDIWRNQFRSKVNGVKLFSLTQKILNQGLVIFPDEYNQKAIVDYINKKCGKIYQLIEIKQQKIEKLNEYKKSIIYEYVTGKKEVQL